MPKTAVVTGHRATGMPSPAHVFSSGTFSPAMAPKGLGPSVSSLAPNPPPPGLPDFRRARSQETAPASPPPAPQPAALHPRGRGREHPAGEHFIEPPCLGGGGGWEWGGDGEGREGSWGAGGVGKGRGRGWISACSRRQSQAAGAPSPHSSFQHCPLPAALQKGSCHPKPPGHSRKPTQAPPAHVNGTSEWPSSAMKKS